MRIKSQLEAATVLKAYLDGWVWYRGFPIEDLVPQVAEILHLDICRIHHEHAIRVLINQACSGNPLLLVA